MKNTAKRIVRKVLEDMLDRRGFRQEWDGCDQSVKSEIRRSLTAVVQNELDKSSSLPGKSGGVGKKGSRPE